MNRLSSMDRQELLRMAKGVASDGRVQAAALGVVAVSISAYILFPGVFIGFLLGIIVLLAAQAAGLVYLWSVVKPPPKPRSLDKEIVGSIGITGKPYHDDNDASVVEFLEASELESAMWLSTRPCEAEDETITGHGKLQRKVKEFSPQFRRVQLEGLRLLLTGPNGANETIYLQGCDVKAFSETEDFKKKWNRKFPLRIQHATRDLWHQSNQVFIYFPNGWQKEMWCLLIRKAIRVKGLLSTQPDPGWQSKARQEFGMYRKRVQSLYPDLLSSMAAPPDRRGEAVETGEGKGAAGMATMYGIQSKLWRRRGKTNGGFGVRQGAAERGDDWEVGSHGSSSSSHGSMPSFGGSWASSGFLDKGAVAPPLDAAPQELQGFRSKLRSFVASKRALLQDRAALGQQPKGASWSAFEGTPEAPEREALTGASPAEAGPGATMVGGAPATVKDILEAKVKDLASDILDVPSDLQAPDAPGAGKGAAPEVPPRPRSALPLKPGGAGSPAVDGADTAGADLWGFRNNSEPPSQPPQTSTGQGQAAASSAAQGGVSDRLESDQGPAGSGGNGSGSSGGGGTEPGLESAVSMFDVLVARLFFDLGFQDTMNKKFQEKLQEKLALILTPSGIGTLTCSHFDFGPTPPLVKSLRSATAASGMPDGFLAFDVELVYQGRASFAIETRLDLKDSPYFKLDGLMGDGEEEEGALEEALGKEFDGLVSSEEGQRERERKGERGEEGGEDAFPSSGSTHGGERTSSPTGEAMRDRHSSVSSSPKQGAVGGEAAGTATGPRRTKSLEPERGRASGAGEGDGLGPSSPSRGSTVSEAPGPSTAGTGRMGQSGGGALRHRGAEPEGSLTAASGSGEEPAARRSSVGTPGGPSEGQAVETGVLYMGAAATSATAAVDSAPTRSRGTILGVGSREKLTLAHSGSASAPGPSLSKRQSFIARGLKDMLVNVASGLSQVPLSITVSVTSVQGVLRIWVPPPPTDRLWMSFVDMPDLNVAFVPSIGERQLRRFPLATKIVDKLKELIKRTMVLPACNDVPVQFMAADQDDWLPREPFMLPWRPAIIPPPCKSASEAFPASLSEAAAELANVNGGRNGEDSEVGWEDEPKAESTMAGLLQAVSGTAKRVGRPDSLLGPARRNNNLPPGPLQSTSEQTPQQKEQQKDQQQQQKEGTQSTQGGLLGATSWRAGPRMGSPNRRNTFTRDPSSSSRSLLAAAKTSFQTATASFVKPQAGTGTATGSAAAAGAAAGVAVGVAAGAGAGGGAGAAAGAAAGAGGPSSSTASAVAAAVATSGGAVAVASAAATAVTSGSGAAASGGASKQIHRDLNGSPFSKSNPGLPPNIPIPVGRSTKARGAEGDRIEATVNSMRADLRSAAGRAVGLLKGRKEGQEGGTPPAPSAAAAAASASSAAPILAALAPISLPTITLAPRASTPPKFSAPASSPALLPSPSLFSAPAPSPYAWPAVSSASPASATQASPSATSFVQAVSATQGVTATGQGASAFSVGPAEWGATSPRPASAQVELLEEWPKSCSFSNWGAALPRGVSPKAAGAPGAFPAAGPGPRALAASGAPSVWYVDEGVVTMEPPPGVSGASSASASSSQFPTSSASASAGAGDLLAEQWSPEGESLGSSGGSEGQALLANPGMALSRISENSEAERGGVRRSVSERNLDGGGSLGSSQGNGEDWNATPLAAHVGSRESEKGADKGDSTEHSSVVLNSDPNSGNLGSSEGSGHSAREAAADWYRLESLGMPAATGGKASTSSRGDAETLTTSKSYSSTPPAASSSVSSGSGSGSAGRGASSRGTARKGSYGEEPGAQAQGQVQPGEWQGGGPRQWGVPEEAQAHTQARAYSGDKVMLVKEDGVVQEGSPRDRLGQGRDAGGSMSEDSGGRGGSLGGGGVGGGSVRRSDGEEGGREGEEVGLFVVGSGSNWGSTGAGSTSPVSVSYGTDEEGRRGTPPIRRELSAAEQLKTRAKDIVGKLGDREVHAHARAVVGERAKEARLVVGERATQARQVVGEKAKEAKEKAKKLMSFLKERHAGPAPGPGSGRGPDEYF